MQKWVYVWLFVMTALTNGCAPRLRNGVYKGSETITVFAGNRYWPGIFKSGPGNKDSLNRPWFHEVTIKVKGGKATITKRPYYLDNGRKIFSYSTGGFYYYGKDDVSFDKKSKTFTISCSLDSCTFCPTLATATPLYTYEHYEIWRQKNKLTVNTNYEKGLIFVRQRKRSRMNNNSKDNKESKR